jgi:hypothetical protein
MGFMGIGTAEFCRIVKQLHLSTLEQNLVFIRDLFVSLSSEFANGNEWQKTIQKFGRFFGPHLQ